MDSQNGLRKPQTTREKIMKKTIFAAVLFALALAGCGGIYQLNNDINTSIGQIMGTYSAPTLASSPTPSGCTDDKCRSLDALEAQGYDLARQKKITWTKLVSAFYDGRAKLYPDSSDSAGTRELISFQRVLAEQMDAGKITQAQWAYLVDKKYAEVQNRNAGQTVRCNTQNTGTSAFPNYQTVCR
jgi:hypothetical protein